MKANLAPAPELDSRDILNRIVTRTIRGEARTLSADRAIHFGDWQWQQGVALYGLMRAYRSTNDDRCLEFVKRWVGDQIQRGIRPKSINTTAPVLAIAELVDVTQDAAGAEICEEYADWCLSKAPRLRDGTFEHSCTENRYPLQVWADTLFMGCVFLAKWGSMRGDKKCIREALFQFERHQRHLVDDHTGLFHHCYDGETGARRGVLWARGNGWCAAASTILLELVDRRAPELGLLEAGLRQRLEGLLKTQSVEGGWHTVMNDRNTYLESSGTAAFAFSLSRAFEKWGDVRHLEAARRAYEFLSGLVTADGELTRASGGTPVMADALEYNAIPYAVTCFSQGLALLAFSGAAGTFPDPPRIR